MFFSFSKTDVLNVKYMRLHRELETAISQVSDSIKLESPSVCHLVHSIAIDTWVESLISGTRADRQIPLKDLQLLSPCTFDRFSTGLDRILATYYSSRNYLTNFVYGSNGLLSNQNSFGLRFGEAPTLLVSRSNDKSFHSDSGFSVFKQSNPTLISKSNSLIESDCHENPDSDAAHKLSASEKILCNLLPSIPQILYPLLTGKFVMIFGAEIRQSTVVQMVNKLR